MRLGKTLRQLESEMTQTEFHRWQWFHAQYRIDDFSVHMRPAALVAQSIAGGEIEPKLNWLQPRPIDATGRFDDASVRTLAAFGLNPQDVK